MDQNGPRVRVIKIVRKPLLREAQISGYANAPYFRSTLSASKPEITSNSSSSMPL
jgi:hypothetical protein